MRQADIDSRKVETYMRLMDNKNKNKRKAKKGGAKKAQDAKKSKKK